MKISPRPMTGPLKPATGPIQAQQSIQIALNDQTNGPTYGGGKPQPPKKA